MTSYLPKKYGPKGFRAKAQINTKGFDARERLGLQMNKGMKAWKIAPE